MVLISDDPICSPIGLIAISAPKLNKPIPIIKKTALIIKINNSRDVRLSKGVKYNSITNIVTGRTDISDSLIFFLIHLAFLPPYILIFVLSSSVAARFFTQTLLFIKKKPIILLMISVD